MQATKNKAKLTSIGLDSEKSEKIGAKLSELLAEYSVFYQNVRGFHWNIQGNNFFVLHEKFEELYNDVKIKVDEVAERILTLGYNPEHNFSEYLKTASIDEAVKVKDGNQAVQHLIDSLQILLKKQRDLLELSDSSNDEGTNAMMSDYIKEQEKLMWMYRSYIS